MVGTLHGGGPESIQVSTEACVERTQSSLKVVGSCQFQVFSERHRRGML